LKTVTAQTNCSTQKIRDYNIVLLRFNFNLILYYVLILYFILFNKDFLIITNEI